MIDETKLQAKGWSESEIRHAQEIIQSARHDFGPLLFWGTITIIIIANIVVALVLVPLLVVLNNIFLDVVVAILGGVVGYLYLFLLKEMTHLEKSHHVFAAILILAVVAINILATVVVANSLIGFLEIENPRHNPLVLVMIYAIALAAPFLIGELYGEKR